MKQNEETERRLASLMRAGQDGDGGAYARLLEEITPLLRKTVRRRLRMLQPHDVEDLAQDILLSLHTVRATYDPGRPFMPWLFGIVQNRVADWARRHARRAVHEVTVEHWPVTSCEESANWEEGYRDHEALAKAIRSLPSGERRAVEMLKLRELSLKEAAAASGQRSAP
jgi:RNA polymerase sigma factor (sigma-70 family)